MSKEKLPVTPRDVFNVKEVDSFIASIAKGHSEEVKTWLNSIYKNALIRQYTHVQQVIIADLGESALSTLMKLIGIEGINNIKKQIKEKNKYVVQPEQAPSWLKEKLEAELPVYAINMAKLSEDKDTMRHVADFLETQTSGMRGRLMHTFDDAVSKTLEWDKKLAQQKVYEEEPGSTDVAYSTDGYDFVLLQAPSALRREGAFLHHCVSGDSYCEMLRRGEHAFVSMRKKGDSLLTIQISCVLEVHDIATAMEIPIVRIGNKYRYERYPFSTELAHTEKYFAVNQIQQRLFNHITQVKGLQNRNMTVEEYDILHKFMKRFGLSLSTAVIIDKKGKVMPADTPPLINNWEVNDRDDDEDDEDDEDDSNHVVGVSVTEWDQSAQKNRGKEMRVESLVKRFTADGQSAKERVEEKGRKKRKEKKKRRGVDEDE